MRKVIVVEVSDIDSNVNIASLSAPYHNYGNMGSPREKYKVISEFSIDDNISIGDSFLCRYNNLNYDFQILGLEKIYTSNNYLELCLVVDNGVLSSIENNTKVEYSNSMTNALVNSPSSYGLTSENPIEIITRVIRNLKTNFRKNIVSGIIEINYKSFDRVNKIDTILNKND